MTAERIKTGGHSNGPARYRFGHLTLDTGRRRLTRGRRTVRLGRLTFDLLQALVEAAPNVVTHDELAQRVWGTRPVSPETLSQRVKLLRDALSDHADHPRYVEVIRGHGHRLIPAVHALPTRWPGPYGLGVPALTSGLIVAVLGAIGWLLVSPGTDTRRDEPAAIAVIPFVIEPGALDPDLFGEMLAEEVINQLSGRGVLRVFPSSASFPFRDNVGELHESDAGLGASHVLKGSFQRDGDSFRMAVQLIECATGHQIWFGSDAHIGGDPDVARTQLASYVVTGLEDFLVPSGNTRPETAPRNVIAQAPN